MKKKLQYKNIVTKKATSTKFFLVLVFVFALFAVYQDNLGAYNIQPAIEDFVLEINEEKNSTLYFTNTTEETQNFKIYSHRYNPETEKILEERNFITLSTETFSLEPEEKSKIEYKINIPEDTIAGSYFSIIVVENIKEKTSTTSSSIGVNYGVGALIAMHVVNDTDIGDIFLKQTEVNLIYKKPLNPFNTKIEYRIKNNSKYTFLPKGQLMVGTKNQKPIFYPINPEEIKLYPNSELVFDFNYKGNLKDLIVNKKALARVGIQFTNTLKETQIELPYLNQTITIAVTWLIITVISITTILIIKKYKDKKIKAIFKDKLFKKKQSVL